MAVKITEQERQQFEKSGQLFRGIRGGPQKQKYWMPDGKEVWKTLCVKNYCIRDLVTGRVIDEGTRDGNLDQGLLLAKPEKLKIHCSGCDKWHNTQGEVKTCVANNKKKQASLERQGMKLFKKMHGGSANGEMEELKAKISNLEALVSKLIEGKK